MSPLGMMTRCLHHPTVRALPFSLVSALQLGNPAGEFNATLVARARPAPALPTHSREPNPPRTRPTLSAMLACLVREVIDTAKSADLVV